MSGQFWLTDEQVEWLRPLFPKARGKPRVDARRVLSGIFHVRTTGSGGRTPRASTDPTRPSATALCPGLGLGVFARIFHVLALLGRDGETIMMGSMPQDAPHGGKPQKRGARPRAIGRTKGGLNSKLHMVGDGRGRPLNVFLSPGQMSDAKGALVLLTEAPPAKRRLGDTSYDADWRRDELKARGVRVCIPARTGRSRPATHNYRLHKKRCRIENAFPAERLARPRHPLHPWRRPLPLRHRARRRRHLLAAVTSPDRRLATWTVGSSEVNASPAA
jgi:transposase